MLLGCVDIWSVWLKWHELFKEVISFAVASHGAYKKYSPCWKFYPFIAFIKILFNIKVKTDFYKIVTKI